MTEIPGFDGRYLATRDGKIYDKYGKDTNKLNPSADNLEWSTQSDNIKHAMKHGLYTKQSDNQSKAAKVSADRNSRPVHQFSMDGEYINTFRNKHDASKATGAMPNNIKACCNGKRKSAGGFIWKY